MTNRKQLFDKARDELKSVFVRSRFRSGDVFRRENIEEWLAGQRVAEMPELVRGKGDEKGWNDLYRQVSNLEKSSWHFLSVLGDCATPYVADVFLGKTSFEPFFRVLFSCLYDKETIRIYEDAEDHLFVAVAENEGFPHYYEWAPGRGTFNLTRLVMRGVAFTVFGGVYSVLLDEWQKHRPKWQAAREFLCNELAKSIERERLEAEKYFEEAVAVTIDGKDIVCCEEVVVIDERKAIIFPPAAFAGNKILANPAKHRFSYDQPMNRQTFKLWLSGLVNNGRLEESGQGQFFAGYRMLDKKDKTRFITDIRYCPDPLPAGGTEISLAAE